ncbi:putative methyl-CpG-binding domain protein 12 [Cocos nucifera]|uniref:Putative methyl-CpG-binding domain protein 12 n=1 Tax=Cocos nucifera TaxID=13894 RepID=A0A8K0HWD3_COCNU|nr:putative methyl-CpG-binding domain protein 12 [Cocos nucifera]
MEQKSRNSKHAGAYAVQCGKCFKFRLIPTKEEFETIRHNFIEDPWICNKNPNVSCDDPGDIEQDGTQIWVADKPNVPKAPPNTERMLTMRKDLSKMDCHYTMPNGKKVRSTVEVEKFLEAYPEYRDQFSVSSFSFTSPKILEEFVPRNLEGRESAKRMKLKTGIPADNLGSNSKGKASERIKKPKKEGSQDNLERNSSGKALAIIKKPKTEGLEDYFEGKALAIVEKPRTQSSDNSEGKSLAIIVKQKTESSEDNSEKKVSAITEKQQTGSSEDNFEEKALAIIEKADIGSLEDNSEDLHIESYINSFSEEASEA